MKKYLILFVIVSLALVLYLRNREAAVKTNLIPAPVQETGLPAGVALPPDAANIQPVDVSRSADSQPLQVQPVSMPPAPNILVNSPLYACAKETKVKDVLSNHDKTWGYMKEDKVKSYAVLQSVGMQEIRDLSVLVGKYQACVSLARDKDLCGSLSKVHGKVDHEINKTCIKTCYSVGFSAYTRGKAGYEYCAGYFKNDLKGAEKFTTERGFCGIAREGLPALTVKFCGSVPAAWRGICLRTFPKDPSGCGNEDCPLLWSVHDALENNRPGTLGPDMGPLAAVLLDKREEHCRQLGDMVVQQYCSVKSRIDAKVQEMSTVKNQDQLNKQLRTGRKNKSED